jgi:steroid delta-isomerase-like uncharacterized protein
MSTKKNKELVRLAYDLQNRRELEKYFELLSPEYTEHLTGMRNTTREQAIQYVPLFFNAFPDIKATIEDMVAEGDKVAIRVTWRGTHKGEFMGIPPSGNKIEMTNTAIFRVAGGKWAECWATMDELRTMQQMGVIPKQ